jgi:TIR domain
MASEAANECPPKAFVSYSWDNPVHKKWVKELATRLRGDGVDVMLDQWEVVPGDQLPKFMETAIRDNSYVLIICTPHYKKKSDERLGGVGYEGDIMTAEVLTQNNDRKFIAALRSGTWATSIPSWLKGKYSIDFSGEPYSEDEYHDLLITLHNKRAQPPPIGKAPQFQKSIREEAKEFYPTKEKADAEFEPIKIEGVLVDEAGRPTNDGTRGSALYAIPFKLSREPTHEWAQLFIQTWDHPPKDTTHHRPDIASVQGDRIVLTQTTIEEVKDVHRETLKLVVESVNRQIAEKVRQRRINEGAKARQEQEHRENLLRIANQIKFD